MYIVDNNINLKTSLQNLFLWIDGTTGTSSFVWKLSLGYWTWFVDLGKLWRYNFQALVIDIDLFWNWKYKLQTENLFARFSVLFLNVNKGNHLTFLPMFPQYSTRYLLVSNLAYKTKTICLLNSILHVWLIYMQVGSRTLGIDLVIVGDSNGQGCL